MKIKILRRVVLNVSTEFFEAIIEQQAILFPGEILDCGDIIEISDNVCFNDKYAERLLDSGYAVRVDENGSEIR